MAAQERDLRSLDESDENSLTGYVHNVSTLKTSARGRKYFLAMLQTSKSENLRMVGFAPEKYADFNAASSLESPVKITQAKLSPTKDGEIEVFIERSTKLQIIKRELDFKKRKIEEPKEQPSVPRQLLEVTDENMLSGEEPDDFRVFDPSISISHLTAEKCDAIRQLTADEPIPHEFTENDEHFGCSSKKHGINLDEVRRLLNRISDAENVSMIQKIVESIETLLASLPNSPPDVEALRLYLILPELHVFDQPKFFSTLLTPFGLHLVNLDKAASRIIDLWMGSLKSRFFSRLVYIYKQTIVYILQLPESMIEREMANRLTGVRVSLDVLKKLNQINEKNGQIVPYHHFYIPELKDRVNIKQDYVHWVQQNRIFPMPGLSFCNYPFVFDGAAKSMLLQTDAFMQMQTAFEEVQRRNIQSLFLPIDPINPMLVLHVTRHNIVTDTLHQLEKQGPADLKKPLKVIFLGEEAVDEGGVRKEFFLLLLREIMDPKYGMFKLYEESRLQWFNPMSFDDKSMFHLIGCLCGLAIYNSTIIQLDFPSALYKKLLKRFSIL